MDINTRKQDELTVTVLIQQYEERLRQKDAQHEAELEKKQRLEWRKHQQKLEELNNTKKIVLLRERELEQLTERLFLKQSECEKLESEIKRLKSMESWKSISPSSSTDDLIPHITVRERDMAMRNSELSFRIRTLEDKISHHKEEKQSLEKKLTCIQKEMSPLKDQNGKLKIRCNELNATLRSREKKLNQLSQDLLDMKSSYQQLQEEYGRNQKCLSQQLNQCSENRTQKQKLLFKNEKLRDAYDKLSARVKELEDYQENSLTFSLPTSPIQGDDHLSVTSSSSQLQEQIDQLEFDKDEIEAKYEEMKNEFKALRDKYKVLHSHYQRCQVKHDDSILQVQRKFGIDQMTLEREVVLLRCARDENLIDQARHKFILLSQEEKIRKLFFRIESLENFIIEQDEVIAKKELRWKEECRRLNGYVNEIVNCHEENGDKFSAKLFIDNESQTTAVSCMSISEVEMWSTTAGCNEPFGSLSDSCDAVLELEPVCGYEETKVKLRSEKQVDTITELKEKITDLQQQLSEEQENTCSLRLLLGDPADLDKLQTENHDDVLFELKSKQQQLSEHNHNLQLELEKKYENFLSQKQDEIIYLKQQLSEEHENSQLLLEESDARNLQCKNQRELNEKQLLSEVQTLEKKKIDHENFLSQKEDEIIHLKQQLSEELANSHDLQLLLEEFDACNLQSKDVTSELEGKQQLSEEQAHNHNLQLLLEKLEKKLIDQEDAHRLQFEMQEDSHRLQFEMQKDSHRLQSRKIEDANRLQSEMQENVITELTAKVNKKTAVNFAQKIRCSLLQVEEACSKVDLSKRLHNLREYMERFIQVVLHDDLLLPKESVFAQPNVKQVHVEKDDIDFKQTHFALKLFLVVMDYDPQSLCITGQPELELSVQSGSIVTVMGEMENGYYTASYNNTMGIVPANFVQEIEICDEELIGRLIKQHRTWNPKHMESEHEAFILLSKEREHILDISEMSATSLEAKGSSDCNEKVSSTQDEEHKTFLGLYDYDPLTSSASANPEFELSFKEGSLIKVFGLEMSDGYYIGELNGQRGLVPANFIVDISTNWQSPSLLGKSKTMIALYDYKPLSDSPNTYSDTELAFRAGDHIVIYGNMHSDGFYTGQLGERFGLVPSNYVKEPE